MKIIKLLSLLAMPLIMAQQTTRFVYQVSIKTDSTDAKSVKTELANLDVSPTESIFYGDKRLKRDSIFARARQTRNFNFDRSMFENLQSNIDFIIKKNYEDQSLVFRSRIGRDEYSYEEKPNFNWKILPETVKIGDYKTQKAEMTYGGRKWDAWFTTDVPVLDGPYKFSGLPGLIVKIEDEKGDYSFDLMESKKIDAPAEFLTRGNVVKLSKKDFLKQNATYRKDPVSYMQSSLNSRGGRGGGNRPSPTPQDRKEQEDRLKKSIADFNNPIELN
ncbi:GLPGLI family protein [Halpernia humi]|uniref:GLPGLI family protein n=1 Tax=Halpernia humi TaxID=493375 RepID=A0A1H5W4I8_9FLAO|nr:GLPGLI family protein [Halpernia humi]SEF93737.1 GLPGLI family protein [Halpernia humi]